MVAERNAMRRLTQAASSMAWSWSNSRYQRVDHPAHTVTSRDSLNE